MCHLAWLIRDNRHLLKVVDGGTCSNGTTFEQLDPNGFKNCLVNLNLFFQSKQNLIHTCIYISLQRRPFDSTTKRYVKNKVI